MTRIVHSALPAASKSTLRCRNTKYDTARPELKPLVGAVALALLSLNGYDVRLANAAPTGAQVTAGAATVHQPNPQSVVVKQSTERAVLNWNSFSIGASESVIFQQPAVSSVALNRVVGQDPSLIHGSLQANGQVFLINPSGILFGRGASVDVGGLVASTLGISNKDFMAGRYAFSGGSGAGSVVNHATIHAANGGYVALLGNQVDNTGTIVANRGSVALGAGDSMLLDFNGDGLLSVKVNTAAAGARIDHRGMIQADGGQVMMSTQAKNALLSTVLNVEGVVMARGVSERDGAIYLDGGRSGVTSVTGSVNANSANSGQRGGEIRVLGEYVGLFDNATLTASGPVGGGTVLVGGDYQGNNPANPNAKETYVGRNARIAADATEQGDGGKIIVWSDRATQFYGEAAARGGSGGGDGGFVEISGKAHLAFRGSVDTTAPKGHAGTLLLDPDLLTIQGGSPPSELSEFSFPPFSGTGPTAGIVGFDSDTSSVIYESEIESQSEITNIVLQARRAIRVGDSPFSNFQINTDGPNPENNQAGVLSLATNSLRLETRNSPADINPAAVAPGIDLVTGAHGTGLRVVTSGKGSITIRTGVGPNGTAADIKLPSIEAGGGGITIHGLQGGNVDITTISTFKGSGFFSGGGGDISVRSNGASPGAITIATPINASGRQFEAGGAVEIAGGEVSVNAITTSGGSNPSVGVGARAGDITLRGSLISLNGGLTALGGNANAGGGSGGAILIDGPTRLSSSVRIDSRGGAGSSPGVAGNITFTGAINANDADNNRTLAIDAANGNVTLGPVGSTQELGALSVVANQLTLNGDVRVNGGGAIDFRNVVEIFFVPGMSIDSDRTGNVSNAGPIMFGAGTTVNTTTDNAALTIDATADGGGRAGIVNLGSIGNPRLAVLEVNGDVISVNGNITAQRIFITADEVRTDPTNGWITATLPFTDFSTTNAALTLRGLSSDGIFGRAAPPETAALRVDVPGLVVVLPSANRASSIVWLRGDPNKKPFYEFANSGTRRQVCYNGDCGNPSITLEEILKIVESPEQRAALNAVLDQLRKLLDEVLMAGFSKENVRKQLVQGIVMETGRARPGIDEFSGEGVAPPATCGLTEPGADSGNLVCP